MQGRFDPLTSTRAFCVALRTRTDTIDPRYRVSAQSSLPCRRDQIVMAVTHFVKCEWRADGRAAPVQTPSTGCVRMLVFEDRRAWTRRTLISAVEQA